MARHFRNRRALSAIITSLILVAIVATIGSVVLFRGLGEVNTFSFNLNNYDKAKIDALREDLIFENVYFNPNSTSLEISVANIGTVETIISTISVVKMTTQEMIVPRNVTNISIQIDDYEKITLNPVLPDGLFNSTWSDQFYHYIPDYNATDPTTHLEEKYQISITTSRGNFFTTVATPYNT